MKVIVLGSAALGGFPQWNCGCPNCRGFREGTIRASKRTQSSIAISSDGIRWFLIDASSDLAHQIEATKELHPASLERARSMQYCSLTPIRIILLAWLPSD